MAKRRDGRAGNARKPETLTRDLLLAAEVETLMRGGVTYEKAIIEVAARRAVGEKLVEAAYNEARRIERMFDPNQSGD